MSASPSGEVLTFRVTWPKLLGSILALGATMFAAYWAAGTLTFSSLREDVQGIRADIAGLAGADTNIRRTVASSDEKMLLQIANAIESLRTESKQDIDRLNTQMQNIGNSVAKLEGRLDVIVRPVTLGEGGLPFGTTVNAKFWETVFSKDIPDDAQFVILPANEAGASALKGLNPTP